MVVSCRLGRDVSQAFPPGALIAAASVHREAIRRTFRRRSEQVRDRRVDRRVQAREGTRDHTSGSSMSRSCVEDATTLLLKVGNSRMHVGDVGAALVPRSIFANWQLARRAVGVM